MFGDAALALIAECRSSEQTGTFWPHNDELVRSVIQETRQLQAVIDSILANLEGGTNEAESNPEYGAQLVVHHIAALRNKRCLLAYHRWRTNWLQRKLWSAGGTLDLVLEDDQGTGVQGEVLRNRLSPAELTYLKEYSKLVTDYKAHFLDVTDICASLHSDSTGPGPPKELMVTVVAQVDAKEVMTEAGTLNLRKGERMRVRRSEIEPLLLRGWVAVAE